MGKYESNYTGQQIDSAIGCVLNLFINKGLDAVEGIVKRNSDGSFGVATIVWNDIGQKPTTIAGYGITDAKIENGVVTLGANTITPVPTSMVKTVVNDTDAEVSTSKAIKTYVDTYGGKIDTISVNGTVQTITNKNVNLLVAELDSNGKVLVNQLPSYVNDVTVDGVSVVTNNIAVISLAGKQDALVSGTNIKTINNNSILGSGNLTIDGGCAVQIVRW